MSVTSAPAAKSKSAPKAAPGMGRYEVGRLLAFAFCAADALIEVNQGGMIIYANGATKPLLGQAPDKLMGQFLNKLCIKDDKALLSALLDRIKDGERFNDVPINIARPNRSDIVVSLNGYNVPGLSNNYYITARMIESGRDVAHGGERNAASGLLTSESFAENVKAQLEGGEGENGELSYIGLSGIRDVFARLDEDGQEGLLRRLGILLKTYSQGGDAAAQLADDRFGLLHDPNLDMETLEGQISEFVRLADPKRVGVGVKTNTVGIETLDLKGKDVAQAVVYSIQQVAQAEPGTDLSKILSTNLQEQVHEAADKIASVKSVIESGNFDVAYQAIVLLEDRAPHHYEALLRMKDGEKKMPQFEFVCFAEEVGQICEFDLAMCSKVISRMKTAAEGGEVLPVAVNISGRSIDSEDFVEKLRALLAEHPVVNGSLMFEITETARINNLDRANEAIRALRDDGFHVCLDDFGAGESAFEYLRELDVDYVKIDGKYVKDAANSAKDQAFLKAMSGLCLDLGIATIAEFVETEETVAFLKECGIAYGQGYLFHRPDVAADPSGDIGNKPQNAKRKGAVEGWS